MLTLFPRLLTRILQTLGRVSTPFAKLLASILQHKKCERTKSRKYVFCIGLIRATEVSQAQTVGVNMTTGLKG